jgi:hypothetical protein
MEQPEMPQEPAANPVELPPPVSEPAPASDQTPKPQLPDTKGALPIPEQFRLPFKGKMATPTSVPSATQRRFNLDHLKKKRRRRGFLLGLLFGQILIIALDVGGGLFLRTHPDVKLQAPFGVASIVFLGMAAGAALMILAVVLIYGAMALRALFGKKTAGVPRAIGQGIKRVIQTSLTLGVTMGVIIGTAWFMIPHAEWKPTIGFAKEKGIEALDASKSKVKAFFTPAPRAQ